MKTHVLDANAIYVFLRNGPGAELVEDVFKAARQANSSALMSVINWGEVYYTLTKRSGLVSANAALRQLDNLPLSILSVDMEQTRVAASLKSSFGLPYVDCFAAALAGRSGVVVTADTKDFRRVP